MMECAIALGRRAASFVDLQPAFYRQKCTSKPLEPLFT